MNLVVDIGNTRTKAALFDQDQFVRKIEVDRALDEVVSDHIDRCILSNTGLIRDDILQSIFTLTDQVVILDHRLQIPFVNRYDTPTTLGRDRIAGVAGACTLYPDQASLIIDAGTCITYDFVRSDGTYIGGNIAPGIDMRIEAMAHFTAKLPQVDTIYNEATMATSTEAALQNGAVHGVLYEIEGLRQVLMKENGDFNTILTGGAGHFLSQYLKREIFVHPDLVLVGLNKILTINA